MNTPLFIVLFIAAVCVCSPPGPWDRFNLAPSSRTVYPTSIYKTVGNITNPENVLRGQPTGIEKGSYITLDFGKEVGGIITLSVHSITGESVELGLGFSESSLFVAVESDSSANCCNSDGVLKKTFKGKEQWTLPPEYLRGGFKYLTLSNNFAGTINIDRVSLEWTPSPDMRDPRNYPNYFYCSDDLLNRIWYAGAYTIQMCTIKSSQGRTWPPPASLWNNSAVVSLGSSVLVDGAKRDRTIWSGDLGVSIPSAFASTNDLDAIRNAMDTLYSVQRSTGELPWSGPIFNLWGSDTYHLWTLVGSCLHYDYTQNKDWLVKTWPRIKLGIDFSISKVTKQNLLNVTLTRDWAREGMGGENIEANAIFYKALVASIPLAKQAGDTESVNKYTTFAKLVKKAVNEILWDEKAGLFKDNPTSTVYPQDGNSLSVWYDLVDGEDRAKTISKKLESRWTKFGGHTVEKNSVSPFIGGMEVHAHFTTGSSDSGVSLIKRQWGYMLDSPVGTNSTFWEGVTMDGNFDNGAPFMSTAHGWAAGPTAALTFYVLGLNLEQDQRISFVPQPSNLKFAQGSITLSSGVVTAKWQRSERFEMMIKAPFNSIIRIGVPTFGEKVTILVNGDLVWNGDQAQPGYEVTVRGSYLDVLHQIDTKILDGVFISSKKV